MRFAKLAGAALAGVILAAPVRGEEPAHDAPPDTAALSPATA